MLPMLTFLQIVVSDWSINTNSSSMGSCEAGLHC